MQQLFLDVNIEFRLVSFSTGISKCFRFQRRNFLFNDNYLCIQYVRLGRIVKEIIKVLEFSSPLGN